MNNTTITEKWQEKYKYAVIHPLTNNSFSCRSKSSIRQNTTEFFLVSSLHVGRNFKTHTAPIPKNIPGRCRKTVLRAVKSLEAQGILERLPGGKSVRMAPKRGERPINQWINYLATKDREWAFFVQFLFFLAWHKGGVKKITQERIKRDMAIDSNTAQEIFEWVRAQPKIDLRRVKQVVFHSIRPFYQHFHGKRMRPKGVDVDYLLNHWKRVPDRVRKRLSENVPVFGRFGGGPLELYKSSLKNLQPVGGNRRDRRQIPSSCYTRRHPQNSAEGELERIFDPLKPIAAIQSTKYTPKESRHRKEKEYENHRKALIEQGCSDERTICETWLKRLFGEKFTFNP